MIKIQNLTKTFKTKKKYKVNALENVTFNLPNKGFVFVVGKSGSGKTTLLSLLGGLDSLTEGEIIVNNQKFSDFKKDDFANYRNNEVGFIFQDYHLIDDLTIFENIKFALDLQQKTDDFSIKSALKSVGLEDFGNRYPKELSGGEKQRIAIARAIVKNPKIILADEPTGNLDKNTTEQILDLLKELSKEKLVLIVSHNKNDALKYADRIIELNAGQITSDVIRNVNYTDSVVIKNGILYVPMNRKLSDIETNFIVQHKGQFNKIIQKDDRFISNTIKIDDIPSESSKFKKSLNFKNRIKLGFRFFKKKWVSTLVYSLIIGGLITVLGLCQLIVKFNKDDVMRKEMSNLNQTSLVLKKSRFSDAPDDYNDRHTLKTTDYDIQQFVNEGYKGNIYKLYNTSMGISGSSMSYANTLPNPSQSGIILPEVYGTLVCTEEYLTAKYGIDGKLEFSALSNDQKPYGVYITDYAADNMIQNINDTSHKNSYEELLGPYIHYNGAYNPGYINGIINTRYRERYKSIFDRLEDPNTSKKEVEKIYKSKEFLSFLDEKGDFLGISYSFNDNFYEDWTTDFDVDYVVSRTGFFNYQDNEFRIVAPVIQPDSRLKPDEISISFDMYSALTGKNINQSNQNQFVPIDIKYTEYDYDYDYKKADTNPLLNLDLHVARLQSTSYLRISPESLKEIVKVNTIPYALYFDDVSINNTLLNKANELGYITNSATAQIVLDMTKVVSMFGDLFKLMSAVIVIAIILLIVSYSLKIIKDRKYEIGVMKSLGCKTKDFMVMFGIHLSILMLATLILYNVGSIFFIDLANNVLVDSILSIKQAVNIGNITLLYNRPIFALYNSLIAVGLGLISCVVALIKLRRIKPINIIKAKE